VAGIETRQADVSGSISLREYGKGGRNLRRLRVLVALVALSAAVASEAHAQGSEPRLLVPPPGSTPAPAPLPGGALPPQGAAPAGPQSVAPSPPPAATPATARLEVRMTQLEQDLRTVTGRLEEVSYQLRKLEDRLNKAVADMDYRLSQVKAGAEGGAAASEAPAREGAGAVAAGGGGVASTPRPRSEVPPAETEPAKTGGAAPAAGPPASSQTAGLPPKTPREQYARAFSLLEKRNYEEAGAGFSEFLKSSPDDPLADNARYWLGETYYARGEYARSAEIFLNAYEKNKAGPKAPDILLKLGLSLAGLDKKKEACASFRELNRAFPNAPGAVKERAAEESKRLNCT
jgi:tol-pal system protein YbgF